MNHMQNPFSQNPANQKSKIFNNHRIFEKEEKQENSGVDAANSNAVQNAEGVNSEEDRIVRIEKMLDLLQKQMQNLLDENRELNKELNLQKEHIVWLNEKTFSEKTFQPTSEKQIANNNFVDEAGGVSMASSQVLGETKTSSTTKALPTIKTSPTEDAAKERGYVLKEDLVSVEKCQKEILSEIKTLQHSINSLSRSGNERSSNEIKNSAAWVVNDTAKQKSGEAVAAEKEIAELPKPNTQTQPKPNSKPMDAGYEEINHSQNFVETSKRESFETLQSPGENNNSANESFTKESFTKEAVIKEAVIKTEDINSKKQEFVNSSFVAKEKNLEEKSLDDMLIENLTGLNKVKHLDSIDAIAKKSQAEIEVAEKAAAANLEKLYEGAIKENSAQKEKTELATETNNSKTNNSAKPASGSFARLGGEKKLSTKEGIIAGKEEGEGEGERQRQSEGEGGDLEMPAKKPQNAFNDINSSNGINSSKLENENVANNGTHKKPTEIEKPSWLKNDDWEDPFAKNDSSMDDDEFVKSFNP